MEIVDLENRNREYEKEIERILEENSYLDNYLYAEYVVTAFINDDRNFQKGRFYRLTKTNRKIFEYCVEVIKFLNPSLYQKYLDSLADGEERKIKNARDNINLIVEGIRTGHLSDGSLYDILDFYRFIPFRESGFDFVHDIKEFMRTSDGLVDGAYETITKYMKDNEITVMIFVTENYVLKNKHLYGGDIVTPKIAHNCFRYMFATGLPKVEAAFKIVLKRYLNKEIDFAELSKLEAKSRKSKKRKAYNNPHKLELKNGFNNEKK